MIKKGISPFWETRRMMENNEAEIFEASCLQVLFREAVIGIEDKKSI